MSITLLRTVEHLILVPERALCVSCGFEVCQALTKECTDAVLVLGSLGTKEMYCLSIEGHIIFSCSASVMS